MKMRLVTVPNHSYQRFHPFSIDLKYHLLIYTKFLSYYSVLFRSLCLSLPTILSGVGNGNPLQYSCLGNSMDRGAWWATVHEVAKSWTQLSMHIHTYTILIAIAFYYQVGQNLPHYAFSPFFFNLKMLVVFKTNFRDLLSNLPFKFMN